MPEELQGVRFFKGMRERPPAPDRNEVINTFNTAYGKLRDIAGREVDASHRPILQKWENGTALDATERAYLGGLDATKKRVLANFEILASAKRQTLDQNRDTFPHEIQRADGSRYTITERIPVEGLLEELYAEIKKIQELVRTGQLNATLGDPQIEELRKLGHTIYKNSRLYPIKYRPTFIQPDTPAHDRTRAEGLYIADDPLRDRGNVTDNFLQGAWTLQNRRELYIPPTTTTTTTNVNTQLGTQTTVNTGPTTATTTATGTPTPTHVPTPTPTPTPGTPRGEPAPTTEPTPTPQPVRVEDIRYNFGMANRSVDIRKRAAELAEEQLRNEMKRGSAWNPLTWVRKIKMRIFEEYYRQKYIERAATAMIANNNSYLQMDVVRNAITDATARITEERQAGRETLERVRMREGRIAGERVAEVQEGPLKTLILNELIHPLINEIRAGTAVNEGTIQQRLREFVARHENHADATVRNQINEIFGRGSTQYGRLAEYFATDMLDLSQTIVRDMNAHHLSLDQIDSKINITLANTTWAAETKAHFNKCDEFIAKMQEYRLTGSIFNPAVLGAAFSLGSFVVIRAPGGIARGIAPFAAPFIGSTIGGLYAGARRSMDLKRDIASHKAERAYGGQKVTKAQIDAQLAGLDPFRRRLARLAGAYRRADLEEFAYDTATTNDLLNGGGTEILTGTNRNSLAQLMSADLSQTANREALARRVAEIRARLDNSHTWNVDLLEFTGRETVEQGRLGLVRAMVEARGALRRAGMNEADIQTMETRFTTEWTNNLAQNRQQKDNAFFNYRFKQALGAGAFGGSVGLAAGLLSQEVVAAGGRFFGAPIGPTTIERAWADITGHRSILDAYPVADAVHEAYNHGGSFAFGARGQMVVDAANNVNIFDETGHPLNNVPLHLDANGHIIGSGKLDPALLQQFKDEHMHIGTTTTEDLIRPTDTNLVDKTFNLEGHTLDMKVPQGILVNGDPWHGEWVKDPTSNAWDLVAWDDKLAAPVKYSGGKIVTLFNDVQFDANGNLINTPDADDLVSYTPETATADPQWVNDLSSGKEVFSNNGYSFLADKGILHVFKNGHEINIYDPSNYLTQPLKVSFVDGKAFIDYTANPQNTVPDVLLDAIKSTNGAVVPNADFGVPRIADLDWQNHLNAIGPSNIFDTQTRLLTDADMIPRVPWPQTETGEHFPFTAKAFDKFLDLKTGHFNATHFFTDGDVVTENGVRVIKFDNGSILFGTNDMMDAYLKVKAGGPDAAEIMKDRFAFWYGKPGDWNAAVLRTSTMEAGIPSQFNGKVWGSFGFVEADGKLHKLIGFGPTESLHTPLNFVKITPPIFALTTPITDTVTAYDITPPIEIPPIVFPFAPRHPLGPMEYIARGSPSIEFGRNVTLGSLIRTGRPRGRQPVTRTTGGYNVQFRDFQTGNIVEGEKALQYINNSFKNSPHVYITLSGAIGDVIHTTAYIDGIRQYAQSLGPGKRITIIVPPNLKDLLTPLANKYNYELITEQRHRCVEKADNMIKSVNEKGAVVFDFDFTEDNGPYPILEDAGNSNIIIHELLSTAVGLYPNDRAGSKRYAEYLGDLLNIPAAQRLNIRPQLPLPANANDIYTDLERRYGIDTNKKQVAVVIEGSGEYKRYSLDNWLAVLKQLEDDGIEFNIIYNPTGGNYQEAELHRVFDQVKNSKLLPTNLTESSVLLQRQKLVLSNDTGLAHIAAVVENGPKVVSLHAYNNLPNIWVTDPQRQTGLWPGADNLPVNNIPPTQVINKAREILRTI